MTKEEKALLIQLAKTRTALFKAVNATNDGILRKTSAAATMAIKNMADFIKRRRIKRQKTTSNRGKRSRARRSGSPRRDNA
jgi:hypothetical protein